MLLPPPYPLSISMFKGDDRMLIERFIEDPHHIEIQVSELPTKYGAHDSSDGSSH